MTSLSLQAITHAIIFILRFKSENDEQGDDFLLTDDLSTVQLHNLHNVFQGDRDHPFSRFKAQNYNLERDDLVLKAIWNRHQNRASIQHNCNCLVCFGIDWNREFREIHMPVSKALFIKVINFSPSQDTILSTGEIYDIIYNLFMIIDNTNVIACTLLKQLLADKELFDKLKTLHQETIHNVTNNYQGTPEAMDIEMRNQEHILHTAFFNIHRIVMEEFIFVYKDEHNNVALTTSKGDNKRKPHVVVDINLKDLWKPFCYLKIDLYFLRQNYLQLQEILYRNSLLRQNVTLDIDFNKFYQLFRFLPEHMEDSVPQSKILEVFLPNVLKHVNAFRLRLSEIICSIDLRFLNDKKTTLFCNNLVFNSAVYLPQNLKCIYIHDSGIEDNLILPASTKALSLKKVIMCTETKIIVNGGCLRIEIDETVGDIDIPVICGIDVLSFNKRWKKCHIFRNNTGVIEELSIVEAVLSQSWVINVGVKKIYLECIKAEGEFRLTINADCESFSLKNCTGVYNLGENALLTNFGLMEFAGEHVFCLSNDKGEYKLKIRNMHLTTGISLNEKIKVIVFEDISIQRHNVFSIHIGCRNISLKNCRGSFEFFFGTNVKRISMFRSNCHFSLQFNEHSGKYKLSLIKVNIEANWILWDKLEDLHLESIRNTNREHFEVKESCNKIKLLKCDGFFKIPGIQNDNQGILKLNISTNELSLTKLSDKGFLLHMSNIFIYQTIHILFDIRSAKLKEIVGCDDANIEFKGRCEVLFMTNCIVLLKQPETSIYRRIILNKMFEIDYFLKAQTKELFINNCTITRDVYFCNTLYKLHFYDVRVLKKNTVTIPGQCMNVMMKKSFGAFLIQSLNEHRNRATMFFERAGNLHFFRCPGSDHYLLKIENCNIKGRICIRRDVKEVILSNVMFTSTHPREKIDEGTILITESLQSLTLKSCLFLYNATIHKKLSHLHLEKMSFNHDVVIGCSIKRLILKEVTIERSSSVVLGKNILYLEIYNINGILNFNGFLDFKRLRFFGDEKVVYKKELQTENVHLKVENLTFVSNYQLAEEVKNLHLTGINTKNNSKILVNRACKKIVTNFKGKIYFIEEKNIDRAVFINLIPLFEIGCWTFGESHNIEEIKIPSHLNSIRFEGIELTTTTVTINEGCKDISIVHCVGNFNLLEIQRLSKLTLHPGILKGPSLEFPDLSYIEELDLAFDFVLDRTEYFLCNCFNVKMLTLRTLTFCPDNSNWRGFITSDAKPSLTFFENFYLNELEKSLRENFPSDENTSSLWMLLNEKMNIFIVPLFNTRSQFKLETLKIVGFYLSDKNLERLSNFSIMRKLSVDYNFVSIGLFEHLPPNLETLEILSSDIFESDNKNSMKNVKNAESIKNVNGPRMIIIEGSYFETVDNFSNLPLNLHSLKISYHDLTSIVYEPSIEKICLRELIVFFKSSKNEKCHFTLSSIEKKICIQEMFSYLGDFIDFSKLDSLMVEDGDKKSEYDRFESY